MLKKDLTKEDQDLFCVFSEYRIMDLSYRMADYN